ncbi:MAG: HIT family protein [Gammaproteobacteria bacterium]|nr:HIT family protein [Gammaproteobacteria bacterium]
MRDEIFELHPNLSADFHPLGRRGAIHLLLRRNAALPWFILVPETDALELYDVPTPLRRELDQLIDALARFVKARFACDKINIAAIGNIVPQLHVHVIGRRRDDCCWPQAAWGHVHETRSYSDTDLAALVQALANEVPNGR